LSSILNRVQSVMSRSVESRVFHVSVLEYKNARSPMDIRHLGSQYSVLSAECRLGSCRVVGDGKVR